MSLGRSCGLMGAEFVVSMIRCIRGAVLFPVIIPPSMHTGGAASILYTT